MAVSSKNGGSGHKLSVLLQSRGVKLEQPLPGRTGGAGPAEGITIMVQGRPITVPTRGSFIAQSPYSLHRQNGALRLFEHAAPLQDVIIPDTPHFYALKTDGGVAYSSIALLHGTDCLASTVFQECIYWDSPRRCSFCGIELSLKSGKTLPTKNPQELLEVAQTAARLDGIKHITLTTGTQGDSLAEFTHLASCCAVLKSTTSLPIHVQVLPPKDRGMLAMLKEAGADTIGMHIESFDTTVLTQVAPCKAEIGRGHFISRWEEAVSLFGRNQVSSFIIAGLGESRKSIVEGSRLLCELGVYPFIVPLRPIPGTLLAEHLPPDPLVMIGIYEQVASLLHAVGLSWKKSTAGCVRCGACSGLPDFEEV